MMALCGSQLDFDGEFYNLLDMNSHSLTLVIPLEGEDSKLGPNGSFYWVKFWIASSFKQDHNVYSLLIVLFFFFLVE